MKLLFENWRQFVNEETKDTYGSEVVDRNKATFKNALVEDEEGFEAHVMYDPKTGEKEKAKTYKRHLKLKEKGWGHEKPQLDEEECWDGYKADGKKPSPSGKKTQSGKTKMVNDCKPINEEEFYEVDAKNVNEEYCPQCTHLKEEEKPCKPSKGKRFAKRVDGKCRSFGQAGQAKGGGDRIRPGTAKGDAYCARSAGIKKCKNPPCANTLSRKKWKCQGKKSVA